MQKCFASGAPCVPAFLMTGLITESASLRIAIRRAPVPFVTLSVRQDGCGK